MKKLMFLAAIAVAVSSAQASAFVWRTSGIKAVEGSGTVTCTAILTAYANGTDEVIATWSGNIVNGVLNGSSSGMTVSSDSLVGNTQYDFVFVATTTFEGQDYVWTSTKKAGINAQSTSNPPLYWFASNHTTGDGINANGWAPVPEPTSGLLVLLGMAGLALRRKRA